MWQKSWGGGCLHCFRALTTLFPLSHVVFIVNFSIQHISKLLFSHQPVRWVDCRSIQFECMSVPRDYPLFVVSSLMVIGFVVSLVAASPLLHESIPLTCWIGILVIMVRANLVLK